MIVIINKMKQDITITIRVIEIQTSRRSNKYTKTRVAKKRKKKEEGGYFLSTRV